MTNAEKIFDQFPHALIHFNKDSQLDYFNNCAAELFGFSQEMEMEELAKLLSEKIGNFFLHDLELFHYTDSQAAKEFSVTINQSDFDTTFFKVEAEVCIMFKPCKIVEKNQEINSASAQKLEFNLRDNWDNSNDLIWDWDLVTGKIWRNKKYNDFLNCKHNEDEHYEIWHRNLHEDDRERVLSGIKHSLETRASYWADAYKYYNREGEIIKVADRGFVSFDTDGKPVRMIGFKIDLSEYITLEREMQKAELKYQDLFSRAKDGIIVCNMDGEILEVNIAFSEISEFSNEDLKGKNIYDFLKLRITEADPIHFDELKEKAPELTIGRILTKSNLVKDLECSTSIISDGNFMTIVRDITEKTQTLKDLSDSETRYKTLADNAPVGIFETNHIGKTIYVNEKLLSFSGRTFDEVMGNLWLDYLHPDDRLKILENWELNAGLEAESISEYRIVDKKGFIRTVQGCAVPTYDYKGKFRGHIGTLVDITKEREALSDLKASEEKYRVLIEQASDAIYICDESGKISTVNKRTVEYSGYSEVELVGKSIYDFINPSDFVEKAKELESLKEGKIIQVTREVRNKAGQSFSFDVTAKSISDGRILVIARDITDKLATQALVVKERDLSNSVINSLPGIFYLHNREGLILKWNKNLETVTGFDHTEMDGIDVRQFFDSSKIEMMTHEAKQVFDFGYGTTNAVFINKNGIKTPYYLSGYRLNYEGETCIIAVGIDISEKIQQEKLLKHSYEEIRELASHLTKIRDEERKRISREIHDELGQKLTAIRMDVGWIFEKGGALNQVAKESLENIVSLLNDGNESVRRILTELRPAILHDRNLIEALKNQNESFVATKKIPIDFTHNFSDVEIPEAVADCIFRVYQESLTNIMRYAEATRVGCDVSIKDDSLSVSITDNGKGFNIKDTGLKKRFGILGMKERIYSQGGELDIQSSEGVGTTISFSIPFVTKKNL